MQGIDLAVLDPSDPDDRRLLILADHPELHDAVRNEVREIKLRSQIVKPELHLAMHEVVANQLWDDNPGEVWLTAQRLLTMGYDRHEVLHMLASVVSNQVWGALHEHQTIDTRHYEARLRELPKSWEAMRPADRPYHSGLRLRPIGVPKRRRRRR